MNYRKYLALFYVGGAFNFLLALFHISFWQIFDWNEDIISLSRNNSAILQVLNIQLILLLLFFSTVSFFYIEELFTTKIGHFVSGTIAAFYFLRAVNQLIFWGITLNSIVIAVVCTAVGLIYITPLYSKTK